MGNIKQRDYYFDNAKAILIFLVVLGHLMNPYIAGEKDLTALYLLIYSFHMPAFLFISGYFAKKAGQPGYLKKMAKKLLIPYIIFFSFFSVYYYITGKNATINLDPFDPVFALWFLLTLFLFHVVLTCVRRFKAKYVLPVAIIISLIAGFSGNIDGYFSASRTIVFFPIFYIGYILKKEHIDALRNRKWIPLSILIFVGFFIFYYIHPINADWLLGSSPYSELNGEGIYSPIKRLLLYVIILVHLAAFLNLTPQNQHFFTYIGTRTMTVYLLHGLIIGVLRGFDIYPFDNGSFATYLYLIVVTVAIVYVLSSRFVVKWTNPVINLQKPSQFKG